MDYYKKAGLHMIPFSNTCYLMDTIQQTPPQEYEHITSEPSLSP